MAPPPVIRCPRCGHSNPASKRTCEVCTLELAPQRNRWLLWLAVLATLSMSVLLLGIGIVALPSLRNRIGLVYPAVQAVPVPTPTELGLGQFQPTPFPTVPTPTHTPVSDPDPIQAQQETQLAEAQATSTALQATVAALRQTATAPQLDTLFTLPPYPGAQVVGINDPFWQGVQQGTAPLGAGVQVEQQAYRIPANDPAAVVFAYYQQNLPLTGWVVWDTGATQSPSVQQQTYARDRQYLVVMVLTVNVGAGVIEPYGVSEVTYLLLTLVTQSP